jgi:hypothetical protein
MNPKLFISSLVASCLCCVLTAQTPEIKWGKIPESDLKMTVYPKDTSAAAVVLADLGNLYFDLSGEEVRVILDCHKRVKILKRTGFDEGDIVIPFYSKDKFENITDVKAQIFQPDGSKRSVERKDFFEEKVSENYTRIKFTFPDVREGSVIEFRYSKAIKNYFRLPTWYFQDNIPVVWSQYHLKIPEFVEYVQLQTGQPPQIVETDARIETLDANSSMRVMNYVLGAKDMPAMKRESFITTMDDYLSHIKFQLSAVKERGIMKPELSTWPKLAERLTEHESIGKRIKMRGTFEDAFDAAGKTVNAAKTPEEKMNAGYDFVRQNMEWDERETIWASEELDKSFHRKKGSVAEINYLVVGLLKAFGLNAYPMLISTRDNGQPIELYPIVEQFNYVIAYLELNGKTYLLDATSKYRPLGLLNENALNSVGWVLHPTEPSWKPIPHSSSNTTRMFTVKLKEDGALKGFYAASYEGYAGEEVRKDLLEPSKDKATEKTSKSDEDVTATTASIQYDSVKVINAEDVYKPLRYNAVVNIPNGATANGDFMYINPVLHPIFDKNPFTLVERIYPVDIPFPISYRYILNLETPPGYVVEDLPEPTNLVLPENAGKFTLLVAKKDSRIQITVTTQLNRLKFEPEDYSEIKKFFDLIIEKQQEQIVLKKSVLADK